MSTKVGITAEEYQVSESVERTQNDAETGLNKQQEESDGLKIHGLALPFGKRSRNGVVYEKESVKEAAETLVGCSLLFNHDENNPIGHIEDVEIKEDGLYYYGDLNEEKRETESLKRGDIPHVSIQATINETAETHEKGIVAIDEFLEMSAVTVPGFSRTDVEAEETVTIEKLMNKETESVEDATDEQQTSKELFEFSPVPSHVLYEDKNDALQRAKDLGLDDVHKHVLQDTEFWMAGSTHEEWKMAIRDELSGSSDGQESNSEKLERALEKKQKILERKEAFDDYPQEAVENARQALEARDNSEFDNDECGTDTGWERANQLDNGENLSEETVSRMHSFFERHDGNQEVDEGPKEEDCGWLMWKAWGGRAAFDWAESKLEEIEESTTKEPFAGFDDFEDCKQTMMDEEGHDEESAKKICGALKKKHEILGEKSTMTNNENTTKEQLEEVNESDFHGTIADMYEGLSASDVAQLMEDFEFSDDPEPLVAQVADLANMTPPDLMELLESEMEGTHGDMDDEEDESTHDDEEDEAGDMDQDDEEDESLNKNEQNQENSQDGDNSDMNEEDEKSKEELRNEIEELKEAVRKIEGTEESKQETGAIASDDGDSFLSDEFKNRIKR